MAESLRIAWQDGVSASRSDGELVVAGRGARLALRNVAAEISGAIERLAPPGGDEEELADFVLTAGGSQLLARWWYYVDQLSRRGFLRRALYRRGRLVAAAIPLGPSHAATLAGGAPGAAYVLSRFAYLRRRGGEFVLESPRSHYRIELYDAWAAAGVAALVSPGTASTLAERIDDTQPEEASALIRLLAETGAIVPIGADGEAEEESDASLASWEFHDLLFHARSRRGRCDAPFGGTFRLAAQSPPPAVKRTAAIETVELHRPDLTRLERDDPPFAAVQERRRSIRAYASRPIGVRQLGEFLFRVARVKDHWQGEVAAPSGPLAMEFTARPYPSGGALYELEFYLVAKACQGLPQGLYHYQPDRHQLSRLGPANAETERLVADAAASAGIAAENVQLLVILAARFQRIAWKYESIAYALVLKHVGVVMQTMYLAATAMGLAPCAVGCGDADVFARAAGLDYYAETSVGEFLLGSRSGGAV